MKILLTYIFILVHLFNGYAQNSLNWKVLNEGIEAHAIDFIDDNNGWLLASDKLWKTEDGGEFWEVYTLPKELRSSTIIKFTSSQIGWATGGEDYLYRNLYKTDDGGLSWIKSFGGTNSSIDMSAVNDSIVFISVYFITSANRCNGQIFKTTDAGKRWIDITPYDLVNDITLGAINFFNQDKGLVVGGCSNNNRKILKTFDGGLNWEIETLPLPFSFISNTQIVSDSTLYFIAHNAKEKPYLHYLGYTTDMFNSWTLTYMSENQMHNFYALDRKNISFIIEDSLGNLYAMKSTDGGYSWQKKQHVWSREQIYFNTLQSGFIMGNGLYRSTDGGESWIKKNFDNSCQDVFFIDDKVGFVGTQEYFHLGPDGGFIYRTTDGGKTWIESTNKPAKSLLFVNESTGYITDHRHIFKTVDQGQIWTKVYENNPDSTGYEIHPVDIGFMNQDSGWAVGYLDYWTTSGSGILGSTDGGNNWDLKWIYPSSDIGFNSIHVINNTAWIVGGNGLIVKSLNADSFAVINTDTDLPLNDVFFIDENHGWIAGGYQNYQNRDDFQSILLKTINRGHSWTELRFYKYLVNDLCFADSLHGWAVGNDTTDTGYWPQGRGVILETKDGGENWLTAAADLPFPLNAIHFKDGFGWAAGDNGLILKTEDGTTWIDQNSGQKYPTKYQLFQNYPNPFNPITNIEYRIPNNALVELSIYNLLGQKLATLVDKKQAAGNYQVEWDASGFASGIYIYRLTANPSSSRTASQQQTAIFTRKLVLLK